MDDFTLNYLLRPQKKVLKHNPKRGDFFCGLLVLKCFSKVEETGIRRHATFRCNCGEEFSRGIHNIVKCPPFGCDKCSRYYRRIENSKYLIQDKKMYGTWRGMNYRCTKEDYECYEHYGKRGIKVCDRWSSDNPRGFDNFFLDMGYYPYHNYSVDRIDLNGDYTPENCRWVTQKVQMNNMSRNHVIDYNGDKYTLQQLGEHLDMKPNTILCRLRRGHHVEDAVKEDLNYKMCKNQGGIIKKGSYEGKVSKADRLQIEELLLLGKTSTEIAGVIGLSFDTVARIKRLYLKIPDTKTLQVFNGEYIEVPLNSSLTQGRVNFVLDMKAEGQTNTFIAKKLSVSSSTITNILRTIKYDKK